MATINATLTWDQTSLQGVSTLFQWSSAPSNTNHPTYTWGEVQLAIKAAGDDYSQWVDFDKKRLIKLILRVHGSTITEEKQKEIKQYKIKVSDIKLAINKIPGIEIMTENIKL